MKLTSVFVFLSVYDYSLHFAKKPLILKKKSFCSWTWWLWSWCPYPWHSFGVQICAQPDRGYGDRCLWKIQGLCVSSPSFIWCCALLLLWLVEWLQSCGGAVTIVFKSPSVGDSFQWSELSIQQKQSFLGNIQGRKGMQCDTVHIQVCIMCWLI